MTSSNTLRRQRYRDGNLAAGKCAECPRERAGTSTRFCLTHLRLNRERLLKHREKRKQARA